MFLEGFGFKSYVGYRMRQRKQRDVAKENEFYLQLLQQALPIDTTVTQIEPAPTTTNSTPAPPPRQTPPVRQSHTSNGQINNQGTAKKHSNNVQISNHVF